MQSISVKNWPLSVLEHALTYTNKPIDSKVPHLWFRFCHFGLCLLTLYASTRYYAEINMSILLFSLGVFFYLSIWLVGFCFFFCIFFTNLPSDEVSGLVPSIWY